MALTRAQLLAGNDTQGTVLPGQVQGVTAGTGVTISNTGSLSINPVDPAFDAFIRTNNSGAFNGYLWPNADGTVGQQLTTNGLGQLVWSDPDGLAWTTLGQLVVGTGVNTQAFLNPGINTSFLLADSNTGPGLVYSNNSKSAALLPAGNNTTDRPAVPIAGQIRYNVTESRFEGYSGVPLAWQPLGGGVPTGGGNDEIFYPNQQTVTANYTVGPAENAVSAGPISINAGVTVTISAGCSWSIV